MSVPLTQLGRTGLKVSRLCLGTMNFGVDTTKEDSFAIMDAALDAGINFFDTADVYGWKTGEGVTEQLLGEYFAHGGERRDRVVLATKLFGRMGNGRQTDWPNTQGLSALHIRRACDASLSRLKTDYIDLYQMHHVDRNTPWDEIWEAYEVLRQQGKILYAGSSNFAGWHIVKAQEAANRRGFLGLVSEQSKYSLMQREIEMEVGPACEDYGIGVIPWSPVAGGALAGIMKGQEGKRRNSEFAQKMREERGDQLNAWEALCDSIGEEPGNVALAWTLTKSFVTAPIIGPRTMEQLQGGIHAAELELSAETLAKIDEIFPPFKTSPEHYAW
ncbi:MAG: aldo/keto reductase [Fimbriimonadaceae bacterium]|nr:aldo/keto reductase [Fimbriimonadaceae bacterium]